MPEQAGAPGDRAGQRDQPGPREAAVTGWLESTGSPHTRAAYTRDITAWFTWCDRRGVPAGGALRADVDAWRDHLAAQGLAGSTIARRLATVSSFYGYLAAQGAIERNPARDAARPRRAPARARSTLTRHQARLLVRHADRLADPPAGTGTRPDPRPAVIVRLLAETGIGVSDLCAARVEDLSAPGGLPALTVTRKRGAPQQLPVTAATWHMIDVYLAGRREGWLVRAERADAIRQPGGQLARQYISGLLRRLGRDAGLPENVWTRLRPGLLRGSLRTGRRGKPGSA
jgi:integrase/recombinase XerD